MTWVGCMDEEVALDLEIQTVWEKGGRRGSWCRAVTPDGHRVGFWTRSKRVKPGAKSTGRWTVWRQVDNHGISVTYVHKPRGVRWQNPS